MGRTHEAGMEESGECGSSCGQGGRTRLARRVRRAEWAVRARPALLRARPALLRARPALLKRPGWQGCWRSTI
eukprot:12080-Chlamydomonas_euryale.AAC.3